MSPSRRHEYFLTDDPGRGATEFIDNVIWEQIPIYCMHFTILNRRCIFFQLNFLTQQFCINFYQEIGTSYFFPTECRGGGGSNPKSPYTKSSINSTICPVSFFPPFFLFPPIFSSLLSFPTYQGINDCYILKEHPLGCYNIKTLISLVFSFFFSTPQIPCK